MPDIKTYSAADLVEIQQKHRLWASSEEGGRSANLSYADLRSADLRYADLRYANLRYANLSSADLRYANLRYADLRYADLRYADLRYADLRYANLRYANLSSADLRYANLRYANLRYGDLRYAKVAWDSHALLAEILRRGAGDDLERRMVAGLLLASNDWCWKDFLKLDHPQKEWALAELRKWLQPNETHPFLRPTLEAKPEAVP